MYHTVDVCMLTTSFHKNHSSPHPRTSPPCYQTAPTIGPERVPRSYYINAGGGGGVGRYTNPPSVIKGRENTGSTGIII
jgi:hypothetical protein